MTDKILKKTKQRLNKERLVGRELREYLKTNQKFLRVKTDNYLATFDRNFCEGADLIDFIEQLDMLMDKGHIFKNDKT